MKRHLLLAFAVLSSLVAFPACSSDDDNGKGTAVEELTINCGVAIAPATVQYALEGDKLISTTNGQRSEATRVGAASGDKPIYGTWAVPIQDTGDPALAAKYEIKYTATFRVEPGRVTASVDCSNNIHPMKSSASSPATITDTTYQILEAHQDVKKWSSLRGETTVGKSSIDTLAVQPQTVGEKDTDVAPGISFIVNQDSGGNRP
ncbi:hypothetical protein LZC95_29090 [Pendulispora brunnea]|uniref:Uncharacterized protein n=1 Tax=Pendulispora brunnea TaxID=2905690 RepID=A0ABZ2K0F1_9BACT